VINLSVTLIYFPQWIFIYSRRTSSSLPLSVFHCLPFSWPHCSGASFSNPPTSKGFTLYLWLIWILDLPACFFHFLFISGCHDNKICFLLLIAQCVFSPFPLYEYECRDQSDRHTPATDNVSEAYTLLICHLAWYFKLFSSFLFSVCQRVFLYLTMCPEWSPQYMQAVRAIRKLQYECPVSALRFQDARFGETSIFLPWCSEAMIAIRRLATHTREHPAVRLKPVIHGPWCKKDF